MNVKRNYSRLCIHEALLGIIGAFICIFKTVDSPSVPLYFLLPLFYGITHLFTKKIYRDEDGMGLVLFEAIAFFRYLVSPVVTCIIGYYDGHVWANTSIYNESAIHMVFELIISYFIMELMRRYVNTQRSKYVDEYHAGKFGLFKGVIVLFFVFIVLTNAEIQRMMFNIGITSESVLNQLTLQQYRSNIPSEYIVFYYVGLVVIYVEILKLIQNSKKLPRGLKIFFIIVASLAYMSCGWTNGRSVSRWAILVAVLSMVYVLLYFYPEKRKSITIGGISVVVVAILIGTFYKRISHGMNLSMIEAFETYLTPEYVNEYFGGLFPVGNGINTILNCDNGRVSTFLYDTVANVPRLLSTFGVTGTSTATYFGEATRHTELIIPNIAMSYYVFSFLGTWVYTSICVALMVLIQTKMKTSKSLYRRLMLFQILFWCSLPMALNIQIIQSNAWKYLIGLILIVFDERFNVRLKRAGGKFVAKES